jgi:transcription antitermination protein NusB
VASRRKAREALLKALYLSESRRITVREAFSEMEAVDHEIEQTPVEREDLPLEPFALGIEEGQKEFALALAYRISRKKDTFNEQIKAVLENWDFSRISRIDRYIMWIALAEMTSMPDIPLNVSFNEAIELAKKFSSGKSSGFVNGILDSVAQNMGLIKRNN